MKKWKLFALFLLSYILVAGLPMVTLFNLYYKEVANSIDETMLQEAQSAASTAMAVLDSHLAIIDNLPLQLYNNRDVLAYKNTGETLKRADVIGLLQQIIGANELIEDIYLYFREPQTFISAYCNSYDAQTMRLYGKACALYYEDIDYDTLFYMLDNHRGSRIMPSQQVKVGAQEAQPIITFVETLPRNNRHAYATILTLVNTKVLDNLIGDSSAIGYMLFDASDMLIVKHLMENENTDPSALLEIISGQQNGAVQTTIGGHDAIMAWNHSMKTGWTMIQFYPQELVVERMYSLQQKTLLILSALSIAIFGLIVASMRKTYKPVGNLYAVASDMRGHDNAVNAFELIEQTMYSLYSKNTDLLNQLNHQSGYMMARTASMLLRKQKEDWTPSHFEEGSRNGLDMGREIYQVLILHYQDPESMQSAIGLAERCCGNEFICSIIEDIFDQFLLILGGKRGELSLFDRLDLTSLAADIIAVGSEVDSPTRWNESYTEAQMISNHAMLHSDGKCVFRKSDLPETIFTSDEAHWSAIHYLSTASYQSDTNTIKASYHNVRSYLLQTTTNFVEAKMIVCQILSCIKDRLPEHCESIEQDLMRLYTRRIGIEAADMADVLGKYLDMFISKVEKRRESEGNSLLERALQFINDNMSSHDLSLSVVAEYVGLSASRFSTLFSQYMGCNYKTYIDNLRIEHAKQLLKEGDQMISEIAEAVGYDNSYSFARLFKKKVGMPPNEYRTQAEHDINEK